MCLIFSKFNFDIYYLYERLKLKCILGSHKIVLWNADKTDFDLRIRDYDYSITLIIIKKINISS